VTVGELFFLLSNDDRNCGSLLHNIVVGRDFCVPQVPKPRTAATLQ